MEDASLDDFHADEETAEDETETPPDGPTGGADTDGVDPARTTHQWTPEGAACDACGQVVERRWTGDAGLVCADCKEW